MCLNQVVEDPEQDQDESLGPEKAWIMRSRVQCSLHHPIVFRVASSPHKALCCHALNSSKNTERQLSEESEEKN